MTTFDLPRNWAPERSSVRPESALKKAVASRLDFADLKYKFNRFSGKVVHAVDSLIGYERLGSDSWKALDRQTDVLGQNLALLNLNRDTFRDNLSAHQESQARIRAFANEKKLSEERLAESFDITNNLYQKRQVGLAQRNLEKIWGRWTNKPAMVDYVEDVKARVERVCTSYVRASGVVAQKEPWEDRNELSVAFQELENQRHFIGNRPAYSGPNGLSGQSVSPRGSSMDRRPEQVSAEWDALSQDLAARANFLREKARGAIN